MTRRCHFGISIALCAACCIWGLLWLALYLGLAAEGERKSACVVLPCSFISVSFFLAAFSGAVWNLNRALRQSRPGANLEAD